MWDFRALKNKLDSLDKSRKSYIDYLDSVARTIDIFEYHKFEAYQAVSALETTDVRSSMKLVFPENEERNELEEKVLVAQAHLQAALYNARAMYDIFAQLLNVLLFETSKQKQIHKCYIQDICNALPTHSLKTSLSEVLNSSEYQYTCGFVNTIKHRNLIQFSPTVNLVELRGGLKIKSFRFNGNQYEEKWAIDILKYSLIIKNRLIDLGEQLNHECGVANT